MNKTLLLDIFFLFLFSTIVNGQTIEKDSLIGSWAYGDMTRGGRSVIQFNMNNTWTIYLPSCTEKNITIEGRKWRLQNNIIYLSFKDKVEPNTFNWKILWNKKGVLQIEEIRFNDGEENPISNIFTMSKSNNLLDQFLISQREYKWLIYFGSECCGTDSNKFLVTLLKDFEKKHNVQIRVTKFDYCGEEGEYSLQFSFLSCPFGMETYYDELLKNEFKNHLNESKLKESSLTILENVKPPYNKSCNEFATSEDWKY